LVTLSYTLYDYTHLPPQPIPTDLTTATSPVLVTLWTNGYFPAGPEGWLDVSIEGFSLGRLFDGDPANDLFHHGGEAVPDTSTTGPLMANIPTSAWQQIIADGSIEISYGFGAESGLPTSATDLIRTDFLWRPEYRMVWGTEDFDSIDEQDSAAPVSIHARGGNDYIVGSAYGDQILGYEGNDLIFGADGDDRVVGNAGNDELSGGEGDDDVLGANGNDVLYGDTGNDKLRGGDDSDNLIGGSGDDFLWGGTGRDWLWGDDGTDRLWGEAGNDDLDGGRGDDYLRGGAGDDRVWGNRGDNHLWGGDGPDQFMFNATDQAGTQHVYDFDRSEGDTLKYFQAFDQVIDDYDIRVGKDGTVVTIADTTIVLSGVFDLTSADIIFLTDADWPWF